MKILIYILFFISIFNVLWAMGSKKDASNCYYADKNGDGINDLYRDVTGDGINDIDSTIIIPHIEFIDEDNDSINDIFCDYDGDGVNDVYTQSKKCLLLILTMITIMILQDHITKKGIIVDINMELLLKNTL